MIGAFEQMSKARTVRWRLRSPSERIATRDHGIDKAFDNVYFTIEGACEIAGWQ